MDLDNKEKEITASIKKGDETAFKELYLSFYKAVVFFINNYVQNSESAEDLAQETFFYLWENSDKLEPSKGCRSYILSIARSKALNHLRNTKYNQQYIICESSTQQENNSNPNYIDHALDPFLNKDLLTMVNTEITKLPEKQREVLILSRKKNYTNKEIAQILQISIKTVEYRLMTALRKIKKNIEAI